MTYKSDITPAEAADMDAWTMAVSVLTGVRMALAKAREEVFVTQAANQAAGTPFGNGVGSKVSLVEALSEAEKSLVSDLGQIARANALPLPRRQG